jgi:hypothetical protein
MGFQEQNQTAYLDKMVTVRNLTDQMFSVKWGGDDYALNPNAEEKVPMWLGRHIMRHATVNGKKVVELVENIKETCGVCNREFEDKRQLGAHSLSHRTKAVVASKE